VDFLCVLQIAQDHTSCRACADQHHAAGRIVHLPPQQPVPLQLNEPVCKAYGQREHELNDDPAHIKGDRHPHEQHRDAGGIDGSEDERSRRGPRKLGIACEAPEALIQLEQPEDEYADNRIDRQEMEPRHEVVIRYARILAVKADPERGKIRARRHDDIVNCQKDRRHMEIFKRKTRLFVDWNGMLLSHFSFPHKPTSCFLREVRRHPPIPYSSFFVLFA
jgi:hypothetical protein